VRLLVSPLALARLLLEPPPLIDGIVELGIGVGDLAPTDVELEAVDQARVAGLAPGQGRELDGEVGDEGRLDQARLHQGVEDVLPESDRSRPRLGRGHTRGQRCPPERVLVGLRSHRETDGLRDGVEEWHAPPGRGEIDGLALVRKGRAPEQHRAEVGEHLLGQGHEVFVVGVGLVELQHGELGIVLGRDALVAEVAVDLVHAVQAAHHEALEIELGGDPEVQGHIQRVVVGDEGLGGRPAGNGLHHRRLHLEKAAGVEEGAQLADEPALHHEGLAHLGVHHEIDVAPAIARLHVLEPMPLLGQGTQRLGQELEASHGDRQLPRPRPEELPGDADEITHVELGERRVPLPQGVGPRVELDLPALVPQMGEAGLAVMPEGDHPPRHGDGSHGLESVFGRVLVSAGELAAPMGDGEALAEGIDPTPPERLELLEPAPDERIGTAGSFIGRRCTRWRRGGRWRGAHVTPISAGRGTPR